MNGYRTKKIALPGGRFIEIVYFSEPGEAGAAALGPAGEALVAAPAPAPEPAPRLHVCPSCASELVYPVSWEERDGGGWRIERRCPNCEWRHVGDHGQEEVESFDDVLNDGTEELLVTLRDVARANMEADVNRLIDAIQLDLIEPMDF